MEERTATLENTIISLLEKKRFSSLQDIFVTMNPFDIAAVFEELPEEPLPLLFRLLPKELAAETFAEMGSDHQELLIKGFSDSELREVIGELYTDDAAALVEEMPASVVKRILNQADPEKRRMINEILNYPEDSAGSIMTTEYVDLRPGMTASEAIDHIRRTGVNKETIDTCYVTDKKPHPDRNDLDPDADSGKRRIRDFRAHGAPRHLCLDHGGSGIRGQHVHEV